MSEASLPSRRVPRAALGQLWIVPPALVLAVLFLYPLALIARQALTDEAGGLSGARAAAVLGSASFGRALVNTVEIAVAATAGCVGLGLVLALILAFVPFPGARLVARIVDTFIALPTFL